MSQFKDEKNQNGSYTTLMSEFKATRGIPETSTNNRNTNTSTRSELPTFLAIDEEDFSSVPYSRMSTSSDSLAPVLSSKEELMQNHAVKELLGTEETYNSKLQIILEAIALDKFKTSSLLISFHEPLQKFKDLSDRLLTNLKTGISAKMSLGDREVLKGLREKLREDFFKVLEIYSALYDELSANQQKYPSEFKAINEHLLSLPQKLGLKEYLIEPIQRGARYTLLVNEIKKQQTGLNSNYIEECDSTVTNLSSSLQQVNSNLAKKQDSRKTIELKTEQKTEPKPEEKPVAKSIFSGWLPDDYRFGDFILRPAAKAFSEGFSEGWNKGPK